MNELPRQVLDCVPLPVPDVATEIVEGEVLLYHPRETRAVYLNSTAAIIWGLCDGLRSIREIIQTIAAGYPEVETESGPDIVTVLQQLKGCGILIMHDDA